MADATARRGELILRDAPDTLGSWLSEVWDHRETLGILVRKDFQTRYKRASFGVIWAVAVPVLQATIMAVVFSKVVRVGSGPHFAMYIFSGMVSYSYFSTALAPASTAIVDGSGLTEKVWFPRALLPVVPCISNLVGFLVTLAVVVATIPAFGVHYSLHQLLLVPAVALLIAFVMSLGLLLAALHVYFRDVRFLVQAALLVWLYISPVLYPEHLLGHLAPLIKANPLSGIISLFHLAVLGTSGPSAAELAVSLGATVVLAVVSVEVQRRHDRLFVDLL